MNQGVLNTFRFQNEKKNMPECISVEILAIAAKIRTAVVWKTWKEGL